MCSRCRLLTGVGHGDLVDLIGVQPDLAQATFQHGSGKPLLQLKGHHDASALLPEAYNEQEKRKKPTAGRCQIELARNDELGRLLRCRGLGLGPKAQIRAWFLELRSEVLIEEAGHAVHGGHHLVLLVLTIC
jgi:hypothetical protein